MWYNAELVLKSYNPDELEVGMFFFTLITIGVIDTIPEIWMLEELPEDKDAFLSKNGAPVELYIIDEDDDILAMPNEIGWYDEGDDSEDLEDISLKQLNKIIQDSNGWLMVEIDKDTPEDEIAPIMIDNKVIIRHLEDDDAYYDEE